MTFDLEEATNKGLERGLERGRIEGREEEATRLIMRILRRKLGEIPPEIETRIANLSTTELENLAEALLDFNNLEDLLNWLN